MKTAKVYPALIAVFFFFLAISLQAQDKKHKPKHGHDSKNNKWKIEKVQGAVKGDQVIFERDPEHDLYFQFPDGLFEGHGGATEVLLSTSHGGTTDLTKTVVSTESGKEYNYAIFVPDLNMFVESNSPPTIIIH
jgi:hypothetical protein